MSSEENQGRIANVIGALRSLLFDNPLLFIIAVTCIAPLGVSIVTNAVESNWETALLLILIESGIILFVVVPVIVIYAWKNNQKELTKERTEQIKTIAKQRLIIEHNRQARFNSMMEAKLETLKAQTDFILSQSERHERRVLKETASDLSEAITKGFSFVEKDELGLEVSKIFDEFNKVQKDYDKILESINRIQKALNITKVKKVDIQVNENILDPNETKTMDADASQVEDLHISTVNVEIPLDAKAKDVLKKALGVVDELSDNAPSDDPPTLFWTCSRCERKNQLKVPKCQGCGLGRAASNDSK